MTQANRIYISTDLNDTIEMERYFAQHDAREYTGSAEEAQEEMQHWVDVLGWATAEQTEENYEEVTVERMQELIRKHVIREDD